jgi:hypothetical protein
MSRKYIRQQILQDFVYPNNEVSQYDVDNVVQDINNNSVSGTVTSFSATTVSSTSITFSISFTWLLNNAEPWIRNSGPVALLSVHMLAPTQNYYKPWRLVASRSTLPNSVFNFTDTFTFTVTASQIGLTTFPNGTYYFEVRFIGHKSIFPVCLSRNINQPAPTPTPSPTVTGTPGPTPTPTTTGPTATPSATPSPTPTSSLFEYGFCGRGQSVSEACNDAGINSRTFYSNCDTGTFGPTCVVYVDSGGSTPLTGYSYIFMNGANWDIVDTTGVVIRYSREQC